LRIITWIASLTESDGSTRESGDVATSSPVDISALETISQKPDVVPDSVADYELDVASSINARWTDGTTQIECSHTGKLWRTKVTKESKSTVVSRHSTMEEAVKEAERIMSGEERDENAAEEKSEFEQEVESILEDVDTESVEEVNEAFGD
jgi:hypothetical protein